MTMGPTTQALPALELRGVAKSFGAVVALASANIRVEMNSIHALVGENGAGKSTLVKIIAGLYQRDGGAFLLRGKPVSFSSTAQAKRAGIAVIYQEPTLFPDLSVTENIFMGRQPADRFGRIDRKAMHAEAERIFTGLAVTMDLERPAAGLSIADQQIIEIAKAISHDAHVLIMDEPTAALSGIEVERLFAVARRLRDEGRGIVFISHRFDEVFALSDTITVMRDGRYISTDAIKDVTEQEIVRRMVGRNITEIFPKQTAVIGEVLLDVNDISSPGVFSHVSFTVRAGEIVALAGLVGAGRSEIARAIFGVDDYTSGTITLSGRKLRRRSPEIAMRSGLALVPEDRRKQGLILDLSVARNTTLSIRNQLSKFGFLTSRAENDSAQVWASRLQVKSSALATLAGTLSGGNQQKVVLAKWLATEPSVLIIDEPTRGIDVGTKAEVHRLISALAGRGIGILMISSELPEVLGMADRVLVIREGRISAEIDRADATAEIVMRAATGCASDGTPVVGSSSATIADSVSGSATGVVEDPDRCATQTARPPNPAARFNRRFFGSRETGILAALVVLIAVTTIVNPSFLFSSDGFRDLLLTPSILVLLAVGQAMVIVTRNLDLSVGSVVGLTAYLAGRLFVDFHGIPVLLVFVVCVIAGGLFGLINGLLVAYGKVPALVITLGTLYAYRGFNVIWTGSNRINSSDMPDAFLNLGTQSFLTIPYLTIIALLVALVAGWYLRNKRGGRELYAIGSNPDAGELYGLDVTRRILTAFVLSGGLAGLAGILFAARYGTTNSQTGTGLELQAVGAAVIGGVAIFGGSGTVYGAAVGAVLLLTINRALPILGIQDFWQQAVVGAVIIGAIVLDRVLSLRLSRKLIAERRVLHD